MKKTILVTGCAGFIGSHVTEKLLNEGHEVIGIDNFDPFYDRKTKERNLKTFSDHSAFHFSEIDIRQRPLLDRLGHTPELIIHLAAKAGVRPSIEDPEGYVQTNIIGTQNLLEWMKDRGINKMLFASSSSVYGNNKKIPFHENDNVDDPISPYAFTKKACELQNHVYHKLYGMSIFNLRFFTVYGERQRPDLAIHKFSRLILEGKPIQMYGDGSTSRDYTYVSDTVHGIMEAMKRILENENPLYETYNLGNNQPVTLSELIRLIEEKAGKKAIIQQLPMQPGDVNRTFADIERAKSVLGYHPQTSLEEGIGRFMDWKKREIAV